MQRVDGRLVLSATDLTKHLACPHVTTLDLEALKNGSQSLSSPDDALNLIFAKGLDHERAYLRSLKATGLNVVEIDVQGAAKAEGEVVTVQAMRAGADVIYQATLYDGDWVGYADFLIRTDRPSALGDWAYDIADTKLARRLKVPALLQMATYAERLEVLQGAAPEFLVVVTGEQRRHPWPLVDVAAYARRRRASLLEAIEARAPTEAVRTAYCVQCRWHADCEKSWLDGDDLNQVAGMRAAQRQTLIDHDTPTMAALAGARRDDIVAVLGPDGARVHDQACLQVNERNTATPTYELLPPEQGRGLLRLPEPSPGDAYLDFEGDPWAEDGAGREYLAGIWDRSATFTTFWAHDLAREKQLTENLVDELTRRWSSHPDMHIYHYAPYEVTALKRLTGRHGTREAELDQLLRHERFVDLYAVVRQGIRVSKPSYSIKKLEAFYWAGARSAQGQDVADALSSVVEYERFLVEGDASILEAIAAYNRDDVRSTHDLHGWLEERRAELAALGHSLQRPLPAELEEISERERDEAHLAERLLAAGHDLLAGCVGWHRREARPRWWEYFRYADLDDNELVEDATAIGGLSTPVHVGDKTGKTGRVTSKIWRYSFPPQDCKIALDEYAADVDTHESVGKVVNLDPVAGWVDLSMRASTQPSIPRGIGPSGPIQDQVLRASIVATANEVLEGTDCAGARLLARCTPPPETLMRCDGESARDVTIRVGAALDGQVLAVQGPPGTGKTHAAAELIRALLDAGKRVGVTALSHAVILNLLETVDRPALHKRSSEEAPNPGKIRTTESVQEILAGLANGGVRLAGGTAWLWAQEGMRDSVDILVIDEAGQFSLANAVAVAPAARSLVLLGDPQQLTQPSQATHPHGAHVSALQHLLGEHETMPTKRGVFLDTTWRMHPTITDFVSSLAYDGRLGSAAGCRLQSITGEGPLAGSGLRWLPVAHADRSTASPEEAGAVRGLVADLLTRSWTDSTGVEHPLSTADILVVAPFNAHVAELRRLIQPGVRAGTVDKFQGQEGVVVIYSMASSTALTAPRGVNFLYDVHRFNVAISRAKALCIVVANQALLDAPAHHPEQLRAVNALCRFVEEAIPL